MSKEVSEFFVQFFQEELDFCDYLLDSEEAKEFIDDELRDILEKERKELKQFLGHPDTITPLNVSNYRNQKKEELKKFEQISKDQMN